MKLSEKTLELNICAQAHHCAAPFHNLLWFGLTQRQEAKAGFDACTKLGGRLLIFQFKASRKVNKSGERVFSAPHAQMQALRSRVKHSVRTIFYAFPLVGTTTELHLNPNVLAQTWLLDVANLPASIPAPTIAGSTALRKSGCHLVYAQPGKARICSEPLEVPLVSFVEFAAQGLAGSDGLHFGQELLGKSSRIPRFERGAKCLVVW